MSRKINVLNPRTGINDYTFNVTTPEEISSIAAKARQGSEKWQKMSHSARTDVMKSFQAALSNKQSEITDALIIDTGRRGISIMEVSGVIQSIDRWINIADCHQEDNLRAGNKTALPSVTYGSQLCPYNLVGIISPWNFPCTLAMIDAIPALLAGCAVIIKPSEVTPRFIEPLVEAIQSIPILCDVLHFIQGDGETGNALISHIDAVCFTGSVNTGRKVASVAADNFIPAFLELGGNDPAIVLEDADIEKAATTLLRASIINTGQACQSIERIYVAKPHYDEFCNLLVEAAKKVHLNRDDISKGHIGPLIYEKQANIIKAQLDDALEQGAKILCGGEIYTDAGAWVEPTVIVDVNHHMKLMKEETFGPIMPVMAFETDEEAVKLANDTDYGLSAAVFSKNLDHAYDIAVKIEAGGISINDGSLTGLVGDAEKNSFKLSGMGGSRMGEAGYLRFFRKKSMLLNSGEPFTINMFDESNST